MTHLSGEERSRYVQAMFARLAPRYDLMNRLMTGGQDTRWRRIVIERAGIPKKGKLLDIATGTGDIAQEALNKSAGITSVGGDFSLEMMMIGRQKRNSQAILWVAADTLTLPFPTDCFDAVTSGFLMRNVIDVPRALEEQVRVTTPGGRVVILESSPLKKNFLRPFIKFHLNTIIPTLGQLVTGQGDAYRYLPDSTHQFQDPESLAELMRRAGLEEASFELYMFGTIAIHVGQKPLQS